MHALVAQDFPIFRQLKSVPGGENPGCPLFYELNKQYWQLATETVLYLDTRGLKVIAATDNLHVWSLSVFGCHVHGLWNCPCRC